MDFKMFSVYLNQVTSDNRGEDLSSGQIWAEVTGPFRERMDKGRRCEAKRASTNIDKRNLKSVGQCKCG